MLLETLIVVDSWLEGNRLAEEESITYLYPLLVSGTKKIGPVSQQTLNILTKTKLTTKKTNISKLEDEIITSHLEI